MKGLRDQTFLVVRTMFPLYDPWMPSTTRSTAHGKWVKGAADLTRGSALQTCLEFRWHTSLTPMVGRLRQENCECQARHRLHSKTHPTPTKGGQTLGSHCVFGQLLCSLLFSENNILLRWCWAFPRNRSQEPGLLLVWCFWCHEMVWVQVKVRLHSLSHKALESNYLTIHVPKLTTNPLQHVNCFQFEFTRRVKSLLAV